MLPFRILVLLAAMVLPSTAPLAAPRARSAPLELHASLRSASRAGPPAPVHRALRDLPVPAETPSVYALVTRWIEGIAVPGSDGKPKIVPVTVRGGLGLAWARRW